MWRISYPLSWETQLNQSECSIVPSSSDEIHYEHSAVTNLFEQDEETFRRILVEYGQQYIGTPGSLFNYQQ